MFAILRGANGRRHEVDFKDDPVIVDVSMSTATVQITMTAARPGNPATRRYVTVTLPERRWRPRWRQQPLVQTSTLKSGCASWTTNDFSFA
jgi:hypothetical protein